MIAALANAAQAFDRPDWLEAAERAFAFVSTRMTSDGRLLHAWRAGEAKAPAIAIRLRQHDPRRAGARQRHRRPRLSSRRRRPGRDVLDQHYWADDLGGYYFAADDTGDLIVRPFSGQDEATPNANGVMVSNLMALYLWTGEERYRDRAEAMLRGFARP